MATRIMCRRANTARRHTAIKNGGPCPPYKLSGCDCSCDSGKSPWHARRGRLAARPPCEDGQPWFRWGSLMLDILYYNGPCLVVNKTPGILTQAPAGIDSLEVRVKAFYREREAK